MANMSYCRFHNTLQSFRDCLNTVEDYIEEGKSIDEFLADLSSDEQYAFRRLVDLSDKLQGAVEELENNVNEMGG